MNVIGHAGTRHLPEIHSNVEPFGMVDSAQGDLRSLKQIHHLIGDFFSGRGQIANMIVGSDHQVTADVRVFIEDYEVVGPTLDDEIFAVRSRILLRLAEDAPAFRFFGSGFCDVLVSPGTPKSFHGEYV